MKPIVSVVIPSFRRQAETLRAARSALRQTGVELEIIVVDDASPEPLRVPDELRRTGRLRLIRLGENTGAAGARNVGVAAAEGDYVAFLDSDDFFLPGTLRARIAFLRCQPVGRPILTVSAVWRWTPGRGASLSEPVPSSNLKELAAGCWYFPGATALFSRRTWEAVGPFDPALRRLEDLEWGIRLACAGGAVAVAPVIGAVVEEGLPARSKPVREAAERIEAHFAGSPCALPTPVLRRLRAYLALERAHSLLGERAYAPFAAEMTRSLLLQPRLSVHQAKWWRRRTAGQVELARIERLALELAQD